jgi:hypothetical protein
MGSLQSSRHSLDCGYAVQRMRVLHVCEELALADGACMVLMQSGSASASTRSVAGERAGADRGDYMA